jgi:rhamnosyltransferase
MLRGMSTLAAVITYQPDETLLRNLRALRAQCAELVVIDNGSANVETVRQACDEAGCRLLANGKNLGVAAALSQAARLAQAEKFQWLATFDQDSLCPPGLVAGLLALYERHPQRDRIGIVSASHRDRALGRDYHHRLDIVSVVDDWRSVRVAITSGSLVRVALFERVGLFDDALFIDAVDHEFCMRLRKFGWLIIESRDHVLEHSIGEATQHRLLGIRVVCSHHSPVRRYYMVRNYLEVSRRNLLTEPAWATKAVLQAAAGGVAALLYERQKLQKLQAIMLGVAHFAVRRFGPKP